MVFPRGVVSVSLLIVAKVDLVVIVFDIVAILIMSMRVVIMVLLVVVCKYQGNGESKKDQTGLGKGLKYKINC